MTFFVIPGDTGIAEVGHLQIENRILLVACPGSAIVEAVREILSLADFSRPGSVSGIDRNQALFPLRAETAAVPAIDYYAAGKHHLVTHFRNRDRQLVPVKQVGADGVSPAHVSPLIAEGVVLKE